MWLLLGGIGVAGVAVGGGVGLSGGFTSDPVPVVVGLTRVPMSQCPGGAPTGWFHRGDGVLAVARSKDDKFLAVRDPRDLGGRVWLDAGVVRAKGSVKNLPVADCGDVGTIGVGAGPTPSQPTATTIDPSATTTSVDGATTTSVAGATPTTANAGGPTTTAKAGSSGTTKPTTPSSTTPGATTTSVAGATTTTAATTTIAGDTTGPVITGAAAAPTTIYEDAGTCSIDKALTSAVSATVTDTSGVSSVTMSWKRFGFEAPYPDKAGLTSKPLTLSKGKYKATLGSFGNVGANTTLVVTLTAKDTKNNTSTATFNVTLNDCYFG